MPQLDLSKLQALVEEAIDQGASTVGEIHQAVAAAPLELLGGIQPLSGVADQAQDVAQRSIGAVYDTIRQVNEQVGMMAETLLAKRSGPADG